ncbi:fucokinase [Entomortierella parvispora]|uniref:Fucokinase n=1 Tax=Entomortierella parvispora TaxID=205924 RepID=A0A9P3HFH1_9FUNG|nr:fucokinase [Entomortierella parvispora]
MLLNTAQRQQSDSLSAAEQDTEEQPSRSLSPLPSASPDAATATTLSSSSSSTVKVPRGTFVYASAPARIDLCGGWTDTIPITHEHGGRVVNVAVNINNKAPYTVRARRTEALILSLSYDVKVPAEHYHSLEQLRDYADPTVPCALLKASIVASGILGITGTRHDEDKISELAPSHPPLRTMAELLKRAGGGLELEVRSSLPVGSGMGTSSILAAAILAVLKILMGEPYTMEDLVYLTLDVEQMMNTGGGWQDQVGGIYPGFKVGTCRLGLPIKIHTTQIEVADTFLDEFDARLVLIYTGQTRLAKNLLQTVLMNWTSQDPKIVETMDRLVQDAEQCEQALRKGKFDSVGTLLSRYFSDKRLLSRTTLHHPPSVGRLLQHLDPYIEGASLAGAGGGGFLVAILRPGLDRDSVLSTVRKAMKQEDLECSEAVDQERSTHQVEEDADVPGGMWSWKASIARTGLVVSVGHEC